MATIPDSIKATLDAQWTAAGGVEPTYYVGEDYTYSSPPPEGDTYIWILSNSLTTTMEPVNDDYSTLVHQCMIVVNTPTSGDRLMEISDEVQRILNSVAITGANYQRIIRRELAPPDMFRVHKEQIIVTVKTFLVDSGAAYGAVATTSFSTDELTVNTWLKLGRTVTAILDEDNMASDSDASLATQQSIKKYVDDNVTAWDTLFELDDTDLSAADPPNKSMLIYSGPSSAWKDETVATMMGYADLNDAGTKNHNDLDNIGTDDHHAKYTDAEVEAIITAEIVGGQSIDNAIDALIATHTAVATAHQDAPALIAAHAGDDNAHHEVVEAHSDLSDTTLTGAYLEDLLMFGSANAAYVPCAYIGREADWSANSYLTAQNGGSTINAYFQLCMPTTKGSLKLYVKGTRYEVLDADANAYVTQVILWGYDSTTDWAWDNLDQDDTNRQASSTVVTDSFNAIDCSEYEYVSYAVYCEVDVANELDFRFLQAHCYYDT